MGLACWENLVGMGLLRRGRWSLPAWPPAGAPADSPSTFPPARPGSLPSQLTIENKWGDPLKHSPWGPGGPESPWPQSLPGRGAWNQEEPVQMGLLRHVSPQGPGRPWALWAGASSPSLETTGGGRAAPWKESSPAARGPSSGQQEGPALPTPGAWLPEARARGRAIAGASPEL